jgi:hypothetical protein
MTHFVIGVIVPKETMKEGKVEDFIDGLMEPYSEEHKVDRYVERDKKELKGNYDNWKKELKEKLLKVKSISEIENSDSLKHYKTFVTVEGKGDLKIKKMTMKEWVEEWENRGDDLDTEGNLTSTFNHESFYDWYAIGGRWDGFFTDKPVDEDNTEAHKETVENNSIAISDMLLHIKKRMNTVEFYNKAKEEILQDMNDMWGGFGWADILRDFVKHKDLSKEESELYEKVRTRFKEYIKDYDFGCKFILGKIMDPKGELHEGVNYGWFGTSKNSKEVDTWNKEYIELLESYKDDYVVLVDCHV